MRSPTSRPRDRRPPRTLWRQVVVTVGAVLGATFLAVAAAGLFLDVKPLVFTSGSMEPQISTGALAFARETPAEELRSGDVVSVTDEQGVRVTHRVVSAEPAAGSTSTSLVLRGDANETADLRPYVVDSGDRVLFDIPLAGYAVTWLSGQEGMACAGLLLGLVLLAAFSRSQRPRHLRVRARRRVSRGALVFCVLGASTQASLALTTTQAFWTDTATATSGTFSALASIPAPSSPVCSEDGTHVDGAWTAPATNPSRYRYVVSANRADTGAQVGSDVFYASSPSHLPWTDFAATSAFTATGKFNFTYRVSTAALSSTTWLSPSYIEIPFHFSADRSDIDCGHDLSTAVAITALGNDSGSSASDFVTNVAANTISGTSTPGDAATIVVKRNGTTVATVSANATTGAWSASITPSEGTQTYTAEATDYLGNTASDSQDVRLDTVAPAAAQSTSCSSVGNGVSGVSGASWCKVTSLSLTATSTDTGGSGVAKQEISNGGAAYATYTSAVALPESNGRTVLIRATDVAGNVSTANSQTYYIDGTAPTLTFTAPVSGTDYGSTSALRTAATNGCTASRVSCGTLADAISGLSATAPNWNLKRVVSGTATCLNSGSYTSTCTNTFAVTKSGSSFSITSGSASTNTIYPTKSGQTDQFYTLTITGLTDLAGNTATARVSTYND